MLRKRTYCHFQLANTANQPSYPHDDVIEGMKARTAFRQHGSEISEQCTAHSRNRTCLRREDEKGSFWAMKSKRNESRIMWIERLLWQENGFKTERQQLCNSRKIWQLFQRWDKQPESLKSHWRRCCVLSETVSVRTRSGYPTSGPDLDRKNGSVWFPTRPKSWTADCGRANPGPVPVNLRVWPGLATPAGSNLWFCILGYTFTVAFRYATVYHIILTLGLLGLFSMYGPP